MLRLHMKTAPGPKGLSIFQEMKAMGKTDPLTFWQDAHTRYGDTIQFKLGLIDIWFFASPDAIYESFVSKHKIMRKGFGYSGLRKLLGEGLITTDKDHWSDQRQRLNPLFSPAAINAYSSSVYDACEAGMEELTQLASSNAQIDIGHAMTRVTMRVISKAAFGVDLTTGHDDIVDAFEFAFGFIADTTADPVRAPLIIPTKQNRKFKAALATIETFIEKLIDNVTTQVPSDGLTDKIFAALEGNDRKLLRDEVISLYFAGFETTARTMTFLMHLLPSHPDILDVLRKEAANLKRPLNGEDIARQLPFANDVVNEALRLYPPVAMMARQTNEDCTIDGYDIRKNSMIIVCPFISQRSSQYWKSGTKFQPSLTPPFQKRVKHRGAFAPFGAGPRICLGKHFAMVELIIAISMIANRFDWTLKDKAPIELDFHGTTRPKSPIYVNLSTR